jgi:hypothetical protein
MTQTDARVLRVDRAFVLGKCSSFVDFQLWPIRTIVNPEHWLDNFTSDEQEHAYHLLNSFMYFSEPLVRDVFLAAFQNLSSYVRKPDRSLRQERVAWRKFCEGLTVTYVTGEQPNPTDSGFIFARMARQFLNFTEQQILHPQEALRALLEGKTDRILFVDDFVGSAQQFISTWRRGYDVARLGQWSFEMYSRSKGGNITTARSVHEQRGRGNCAFLPRCAGVSRERSWSPVQRDRARFDRLASAPQRNGSIIY